MFKYKVLGPYVLVKAQMKTQTKAGIVLALDGRESNEILNKDKDKVLMNETIIGIGTGIKDDKLAIGMKIHTWKKDLLKIEKVKLIEFGMDEKEIREEDRFYLAHEDKIVGVV